MKVLYITTIGTTMVFFQEHIKMLLSEGYTVELACNNDGDNQAPDFYKTLGIPIHNIPFSRSPFSTDNIKAYKEFKHLIQTNHYDIIHTHTPIASVLVRLACKPYRKGELKVFYTAHGFHFYKGAPIKNWIFYYPIEWICSQWTDVLITINKEDYALAQKRMKAKEVDYVPGMGVDTKRFSLHTVSKKGKRQELGIPESAFVLLSVGELADRKNQKVVIDALGELQDQSIYYVIVGTGNLYDAFQNLSKQYGIKDNVLLLGERTDVDELCDMADVFVHPSVREGFGIAPLEAMAAGLPLISTYINGMRDYTLDGITGCCINDPKDVEQMKESILRMKNDDKFCLKCSYNNELIAPKFDTKNSVKTMQEIYNREGVKPNRYYNEIVLRREFNLKPNNKVLTYVAELNSNKNQISLLYMLRELCNYRNDVMLILVGTGNAEESLHKKASELGISRHVIFAGFRYDVPLILRLTDVYVASSKREGLGINVIEAMSSGIPVVAYDNRGHRSIIEDGINGFLVKNGDYKLMAQRVSKLLNDINMRRKFSIEATKRAQMFSNEVVCMRMKEIYDRIN